jgi:preprotein translocase subunit SecE
MTNEKSPALEKEQRKPEKESKVEKAGLAAQVAQIQVFISEVKSEFFKIAWPNRKNTVGSAILVVVLVTVMSLYLGAVDLLLGKLISYILK